MIFLFSERILMQKELAELSSSCNYLFSKEMGLFNRCKNLDEK
jgi:hypothetical protein